MKKKISAEGLLELMTEYSISVPELAKLSGASRAILYKYLKEDSIPFSKHTFLSTIIQESFSTAVSNCTGKSNATLENSELVSFEEIRSQTFDSPNSKQKAITKFFDNYFSSLTKNIKEEASSSILTLDYLADNRSVFRKFKTDCKIFFSYQRCLTDYLQKIEEHIEHQLSRGRNFHYTRIFQPPLSCNNTDQLEHIELLSTVLKYLHPRMFEHVENLKWLKSKYDGMAKLKANFFCLSIAARPYSIMILDNQSLVTEHLTSDKNRILLPDLLEFESHLSRSTKRKIDSYDAQISRILSHYKPLDLVDISASMTMALTSTYKSFEKSLEALKSKESEINILKRRFPIDMKHFQSMRNDFDDLTHDSEKRTDDLIFLLNNVASNKYLWNSFDWFVSSEFNKDPLFRQSLVQHSKPTQVSTFAKTITHLLSQRIYPKLNRKSSVAPIANQKFQPV